MKLKLKIFASLLLLVVGGIAGAKWQASYDKMQYDKSVNGPSQGQQAGLNKASVMIDASSDAPQVFSNVEIKQNQSLFDLTRDLAAANNLKFDFKDFGELGYLVTQIGDASNGTDDRFWQYWVNNEQVQIAADKYLVKSGDVILWKFSKSKL